MARDKSLDIAKGIGIVLMVIGHCYHTENIVLKTIYSFHMPLFFIVSGMLLSMAGGGKPRIVQRAVRTLVPYFSFELAYILLLSTLALTMGLESTIQRFLGLFSKTVTLNGTSVCWYLPCLLIAEVIFTELNRLTHKAIVLAGVATLFVCGLLVPVSGWWIVLWRSFAGVGFLAMGYLGYKVFTKAYHWSLYVSVLLVFAVSMHCNIFVSLVGLRFGNPLLYVLSSVCGSFLLIQMSRKLSANKENAVISWVVYLGQNTLIILGTHMLFVEIIRLLDYKLFDNALYRLGILEGVVFAALVIGCEMVVIPIVNRYFWFVLGKRKRK